MTWIYVSNDRFDVRIHRIWLYFLRGPQSRVCCTHVSKFGRSELNIPITEIVGCVDDHGGFTGVRTNEWKQKGNNNLRGSFEEITVRFRFITVWTILRGKRSLNINSHLCLYIFILYRRPSILSRSRNGKILTRAQSEHNPPFEKSSNDNCASKTFRLSPVIYYCPVSTHPASPATVSAQKQFYRRVCIRQMRFLIHLPRFVIL